MNRKSNNPLDNIPDYEADKPTCACGSIKTRFVGLDDPMVPTMRVYKCDDCGAETFTPATNQDGAIAWGGYDPYSDY